MVDARDDTVNLRSFYGAMVRHIWVAWAREQPNPKPSWLVEWHELPEADKEVDRRIGWGIAQDVLDRVAKPLKDEVAMLTAERDRLDQQITELSHKHLDRERQYTHDWRSLRAENTDLRTEHAAAVERAAQCVTALSWAVETLDASEQSGGMIMVEWRDWRDDVARPALADPDTP